MEKLKPYKDPELDRIKRELSRRIMKAFREGRLRQEIEAMDREALAAYRELDNGRRKRKRR